jgi:hypothetical protein
MRKYFSWQDSKRRWVPHAIRNFYCPAALRVCDTACDVDENQASNGKKYLKVFQTIQNENKPKIKKRSNCCAVKELSQYVFVSENQNYKVNFTMFITIKAVRNSCVPRTQEEFDTILNQKYN